MQIQLNIPYVDSRASDLSFSHQTQALPSLGKISFNLKGLELDLSLLGCSHQAFLSYEDQSLIETVACLKGTEAYLPPSYGLDFLDYHFNSEVLTDNFKDRSQEILADLKTDQLSLVGLFPGEQAFTGLRITPESDSLGWESWHSYPQTGELVYTKAGVKL